MSSAQEPQAELVGVAKAIKDLDDLVKLTLVGLPPMKPWQRQLAGALADVDRLVQLLRMTIVMERPDSEILTASTALTAGCRRAAGLIAGSRADLMTVTSLRLATDLADRIRIELGRHESLSDGGAKPV